jgi:hypothetical protein
MANSLNASSTIKQVVFEDFPESQTAGTTIARRKRFYIVGSVITTDIIDMTVYDSNISAIEWALSTTNSATVNSPGTATWAKSGVGATCKVSAGGANIVIMGVVRLN